MNNSTYVFKLMRKYHSQHSAPNKDQNIKLLRLLLIFDHLRINVLSWKGYYKIEQPKQHMVFIGVYQPFKTALFTDINICRTSIIYAKIQVNVIMSINVKL